MVIDDKGGMHVSNPLDGMAAGPVRDVLEFVKWVKGRGAEPALVEDVEDASEAAEKKCGGVSTAASSGAAAADSVEVAAAALELDKKAGKVKERLAAGNRENPYDRG